MSDCKVTKVPSYFPSNVCNINSQNYDRRLCDRGQRIDVLDGCISCVIVMCNMTKQKSNVIFCN